MRVNTVKSARKDQGKCGKCGREIAKGDGYRWWKFRYGGKRIRCMSFSCSPKPQDLTQNEILIAMYDIMEEEAGEFEDADEVQAWADDVAQRVRDEVVSLISDKMSNIESGFGHTDIPAYYDLEEMEGNAESWAEEIERAGWYDGDSEGDEYDMEEHIAQVLDAIGNGF